MEPGPGVRHPRAELARDSGGHRHRDSPSPRASVSVRPHILFCLRESGGRSDRGPGARAAAQAMAEEHYAEAIGRLEAAGYQRYEVSNFAVPGHECRHNLAYWRGEDYLGVGASAVSTVGAERRTNPERVVDYLAGASARIEGVDASTRLWEKAMLGLRTSEGVRRGRSPTCAGPGGSGQAAGAGLSGEALW